MSTRPALRRLVDLPGIADLELKAVMKREFAEPEARAEHPEIDACSKALFGLTADEAAAVPRPTDWDGIEQRPIMDQVNAFEDAGWDVTDKRRPLRTLGHFSAQLWLAIRGVAGELPFLPEPAAKADDWAAKLTSEAKAWRRR
ncbi:MAG TPA: hypothetical protein VIO94_03650 [Phenylobacterium sp.]